MKRKMKKVISVILTILYILSMPFVCAFGEEVEVISSSDDAVILSEDFEEDADLLWSGGTRDSVAACEGDFGVVVSNPYGDADTAVFGHILEYSDYISLEAGKFYTFSAYIMNPVASKASEPEASAYIGKNGDSLFIDISSAGSEFSLITASFMANESLTCRPCISIEGGDMDIGFFMDSITIYEETKLPEYALIEGPDSVFVPENKARAYRYSIVIYDSDAERVNVLTDSYSFESDDLPAGVELDESTGILTVSCDAAADMEFTITCNASVGDRLQTESKKVFTTKNLLSDPSFENGEELWESELDIEYADGAVSLYASEDGDYGKYTYMTYRDQLFLSGGKMYVFRADVKSDEHFDSSQVFISNLSFAQSGYAEINITDIGGEMTKVIGAFRVEDTGLYEFTLKLSAPTERPIYVDNVYLGIEDEAPSSISIRAPGNVCIPSDEVILPCYGEVLNQLGEVMEDLEPVVTISPSDEGVFLEDGVIIVTNHAHSDDYTVTATYEDVTAQLDITISRNYIGDGGFEEKVANEWWAASDGAIFTIFEYDGDLAGHIHSIDNECLLINNSYMELDADEYYVLSAFSDLADGYVTAFIDDMYSGEFVPFAQFDLTNDIRVPFSVDETVFGRLVLYIECEDSVGVIFDDINIEPWDLSASDVSVSGGDWGEYLRGSYNYINNMSLAPDADISSTRWYISSSPDGHFEPIGVPNQDYLEFTEDMAGQYVIYEVTPICSYTGLVGEAIRSAPLLVAGEDSLDVPDDIPLSSLIPIEIEHSLTHPFNDISSHWCEDMISALAYSGVVAGKTPTRFYPENYVTRAEFITMLSRSFSLVSLPYSGQFEDVSDKDWYSGWIEAAYKRGIITGVSETEFMPNRYITREEMAVIIYRTYLLAKGPMPYDIELRYDDTYMISTWSYEAVKTTTNLSLFHGNEMNLFKPHDKSTRAEAAAVIYRTLKSFY